MHFGPRVQRPEAARPNRPAMGDELSAFPAQLSSFSKKSGNLGEREPILPEKLMATFEHTQVRSRDFSNHVFL